MNANFKIFLRIDNYSVFFNKKKENMKDLQQKQLQVKNVSEKMLCSLEKGEIVKQKS